MKKYGLLGKKLGHSFSKQIHSLLADYSYEYFEREEEDIEDLFLDEEIKGFNITIPYKIDSMKYCKEISEKAKNIGCINTVYRNENGEWLGENTDYFGFFYLLKRKLKNKTVKSALILGDGATSLTVEEVLKDLGISYAKLSRKTSPFYNEVDNYKEAELIINTTPVGMYPNNGEKLISLENFKNLKLVVDVVYNPLKTALLLEAEKLGIENSNGLSMLVAQAAVAAELFSQTKINEEKIEEIIKELSQQVENIVLVGMPGSGKSTLGKELALLTGKNFIDTDEEIVKRIGRPIPEIFQEKGEEYFRNLETEVLYEYVGKQNNQIISCGGGIIVKDRNYDLLKQNARIYWILRDLDDLEVIGRPISKDRQRLEYLWETRKDKYKYFADFSVKNDVIEDAAKEILEDFYNNFTS